MDYTASYPRRWPPLLEPQILQEFIKLINLPCKSTEDWMMRR
jgi:hypothetical protein